MVANMSSVAQRMRLREIHGNPPKPWSNEQPPGENASKPTPQAATKPSPPKPFKFESLAAVNFKTRKWICKDCGKETLHKHRLRHAQTCKKERAKTSREWEEQQDQKRGSCFYCHAQDHWVANCPVKKMRRFL